jgi:uncharacterized protein (DUF1697 family)
MATTTYVALLPGINVGGHKRITMADLAACFREAGCDHVKTYVQSGNVVFTSAMARRTLVGKLEAAITAGTGHEIRVLLRTGPELARVVQENPFADRDDEAKTVHAVFLDRTGAEALGSFDATRFAPEEVAPGRNELYLHLPAGMGRAKLPVALFRATAKAGVVTTARNWRSVTKLLDLAREIDAAR